MKAASSAALAILAGGKYICAHLYDLTLQNGSAYHFTSFQIPLIAAIHPSATLNTYLTGLTITRGATTQQTGLDVQELELTISAQPDNPAGAILISGFPLMQAARLGLLDGASVIYSKLFMNFPTVGAQLDTSPKAIDWFHGNVADIDPVGRFGLTLKVACGLQYLTVQMPRNVYQSGCTHTVYDAGCTLSKATFTEATGVISSATDGANFVTNLGGTGGGDHYFELGVMKFTTGANAGFASTVKTFRTPTGAMSVVFPFPKTPTAGDAFTVYPGCDRTQATCSGKFSNLAHFKAMPYVPVTETLYDGGTSNPPNPSAPGQQAGSTIGSQVGGRIQP